MGYVSKSYLETQFQNFATRISLVFAKKSEIPTNVVTDANYVHTDNNYTDADKTKVDSSVLFTAQTLTNAQKLQARTNIGAFSGNYSDLIGAPTNLSDFTNDTNFITNTVNNLTNYYTKTETYTQTEVDNLISTIPKMNIEVVAQLPTTDISTTTIYLVPSASSTTGNVKDEYINLDGTTSGWELIGSTSVDLSNYLTKTEASTTYVQITDVETENIDFSTYFVDPSSS